MKANIDIDGLLFQLKTRIETMETIQELKPKYEFQNPNENILLAENESVTISDSKNNITGRGNAFVHASRRPKIKLTIPLRNNGENDILKIYFGMLSNRENQKTILILNDRGISIEKGHISSFDNVTITSEKTNNEALITWSPLEYPFIVLGSEKTEMDSFVFHLLNCPELSTPNGKEITENGGAYSVSIITLKWNGWIIEFKTVRQTHINIDLIHKSGGVALTYVGIIHREDNLLFTMEDMELLRRGFSCFMDFVVGRRCWPCLCTGYENNKKVYEDWGTNFSEWYTPMTWGTGNAINFKASETLEVLFPLFMDLYNQTELEEALHETVYWYRNTTEPGNPPIDLALILIQAGIERLSYEYAVNFKQLISAKGFSDIRASDKFRLLFSSLGIPLHIPHELKDIMALGKQLNWLDGPHCLTEIRNAMIHPEHKKKDQIKDIYYDAWRLAIEYLELGILGFCKYRGMYYSRIREKNMPVPWATA